MALLGLVVLWHLANPEMQRQARIQWVYGMDDVCTVGCTFGWRKYLWSRWTVWPWHSNISGETLQKYKKNKQKQNSDVLLCSRNLFLRKSPRTSWMNAKQAGVRRGVEEGSASLYGWRYRRLSQRGDELLLNSENLKAFKHICHDAISHYRQKKKY